jgi:hypothetical protein
MTTSTNAGSIKAITKIVTFYSDGTFSEYTPSPGSLPPITNPGPYVGPPMNPITPWPAPWWQNPISYGHNGQSINCADSSSESEGRN